MDNTDRASQLNSAMAHLDARRWRLAEVQCRMILALDPNDIEAILVLGLAIAASGEAGRAAPILGRVRKARPEHDDPCRDLASLRPRVPRAVVARQYRACLRLAPGDARLRRDFATYLLDGGDPDTALTILRDAPEVPETLTLRGMALAETGKFRDAARCFESAVRQAPRMPDHWANLAMMTRIEGRFDDSIAGYDRALGLDGADPQLRVNRALALLHAGRWTEAWGEYETRFDRPGFARISDAPLLDTVTPDTRLDGKTVLVWHEDGYGDTIQFARYLPALGALGARVTVLVPAQLERLLSCMAGISIARIGDGPVPRHDLQCPFFSLPRAFGATTRNVPAGPYLSADPALAAAWSARVPRQSGELSVGLVWSGLARPWLHGFTAVDRRRSAGLAAFAPLATVRGTQFVSLQAGTSASQGQDPPMGMTLVDPMDAVQDFADTAAIIANLDVVVSVDTSVAHLAGAMGKRVFLLDRYDNCWRWLHGRADTPWYPSMTIFRQPRPGDWASAMHRAASALAALMIIPGTTPGSGLANAA